MRARNNNKLSIPYDKATRISSSKIFSGGRSDRASLRITCGYSRTPENPVHGIVRIFETVLESVLGQSDMTRSWMERHDRIILSGFSLHGTKRLLQVFLLLPKTCSRVN